MKNKINTLLVFLWMGLTVVAQTPQHVVQNDKEQKNFWESSNTIILGVVFIVVLVVARGWSKRIHKRRDEIINKDKDQKK